MPRSSSFRLICLATGLVALFFLGVLPFHYRRKPPSTSLNSFLREGLRLPIAEEPENPSDQNQLNNFTYQTLSSLRTDLVEYLQVHAALPDDLERIDDVQALLKDFFKDGHLDSIWRPANGKDSWGRAFRVTQAQGGTTLVLASAGANGIFETGGGDDIWVLISLRDGKIEVTERLFHARRGEGQRRHYSYERKTTKKS